MRNILSAAATACAPAHLPRAHRVLAFGWWLFIATFFIAPDVHALRMTFYAVVALPAVIWSRLLIREIDWRDPLWLSVFITLLFLSLSALWGADAADSHARRAIKIMVILFICFLVPRFLVGAGLLSIRHLTRAILGLATFVAIGNLIANLFLVLSGVEPFGQYVRLAGFGQLDNPLLYGGIMGGSALLALCEFLREPRRSRQVLLLLVLAVLGTALVLTMSRGPILYFLVVSAMIAAVYRAHWRRTLLLVLLASAAALSVVLYPASQTVIDANVSRPTYRPVIWSSVMAEMPGKELFGQGWRDDQSVYTPAGRFGHPHNFLLGIYRFGGLVGLALFIAMTGLLFHGCARLGRDNAVSLGAWLLYGILLHLTNGRFPVSAPGGVWFFYWLPAALVFGFARPVSVRQAEEVP